jgi:hypothetical protein
MATEVIESASPKSSPPVKPTLDVFQKYKTRELQWQQLNSQIQFQNATTHARTADASFRDWISGLVKDLAIDVAVWQLNLDTLEFEPRIPNAS